MFDPAVNVVFFSSSVLLLLLLFFLLFWFDVLLAGGAAWLRGGPVQYGPDAGQLHGCSAQKNDGSTWPWASTERGTRPCPPEPYDPPLWNELPPPGQNPLGKFSVFNFVRGVNHWLHEIENLIMGGFSLYSQTLVKQKSTYCSSGG